MVAEILSNLSSYALLVASFFLVHHYKVDESRWSTSIAIAFVVFSISLIVNSISRIIDETYFLVLIGGIVTKVSMFVILVLHLLQILEKENSDGKTARPK